MYIFGTSYRLKSKAIALLFSFLGIIAATTTRICAQGPIGMDAMQETPQIEWRGAVVAQEGNIYHLEFTCSVPAGWHIYDVKEYNNGPISTSVKLEGEAKAIGVLTLTSNVKEEYDSAFGMVIGTCEGAVSMLLKVESNAAAPKQIKAIIEWQACREGACSAPEEQEINITLPATAELNSGANTTTTGSIRDAQSSKSLWSTILEAILWGFVALLTPCVFPMVPMTVSFFLKKSGDKTKGRFMAMMYGLCIVALYTIPIAIIILITYFAGGDSGIVFIFNWLATHWIPNLLFFIIFMIFAASFFGAFEIVMPTSLVNKADAKSEKGGLFGVFFMALTLVLVSFSCTGPIVGTILIKSTQGEIWEPIITMLAFSAAFALPFTIFAFVPSLLKNLPKSGGWLNTVKVVLGFLELALGMKFLSVADQTYHWGILDREVYLAFWIVIFSLLGLYLLGKIRFQYDSEMPVQKSWIRFIVAIFTFTFVIYMLPGMWGAPLKAISGWLPPMETQDFNISEIVRKETKFVLSPNSENAKEEPKYADQLHFPNGIEGYFDYDQALRVAKKMNKPIFVDFTGHGCTNCRKVENTVWIADAVREKFTNDFVLLAMYVDDKKVKLDKEDYIVDNDGKTLTMLGEKNTFISNQKYKENSQWMRKQTAKAVRGRSKRGTE